MIEPGDVAAGSLHVQEVPRVGILAADAMQVGPGALRAPQERMVVDELAGLRVLAVALGLGADRPDHLRVAADAALADVEVAPLELERRVRAAPTRSSARSTRMSAVGTNSTTPPMSTATNVSTANCVGRALERAMPGRPLRRRAPAAAAAPRAASSRIERALRARSCTGCTRQPAAPRMKSVPPTTRSAVHRHDAHDRLEEVAGSAACRRLVNSRHIRLCVMPRDVDRDRVEQDAERRQPEVRRWRARTEYSFVP